MTAPALLLVAHGSRDPRFAATAERVRSAVRTELPGVTVGLSYLDLTEPLVGDALSQLAETVGDVVVVPLLFGDGYHSRFDLPAIISAAKRQHPALHAVQTRVVGDTSLVPALAARLDEAGLRGSDGVVMCAVGSSDADSDAQARRRGAELSALTRVPVEVVFATKLGRADAELRRAASRLRSQGARRIALSPYFLSAGLLTERVNERLRALEPGVVVAGAIGDHPALTAAVVERFAAARPVVDTTLAVTAS
ncbi:sirohydrochlorin chelatase [Gordonia sp. TBRC 11910]|uniref:Sirohydrochlorin chelatase n=1 Tax=Gordonia asplenii TaxID=2725283 RepID=A0A848KS74_9ACTN|nr:sirohydrochlorin chelatase [Gordonia asplenii]NMO01280.1 sirohydrochlorin chelatase [Gordonia asplenii]